MKFADFYYTELFENPLPIKWYERDDHMWIGRFAVENAQFEIVFMYDPFEKSWDISFERTNAAGNLYGLTGDGNAALVFSTVSAAIQQWLNAIKPNRFSMDAEEPNRLRLYLRMLKKYLFPPQDWNVQVLGQEIVAQRTKMIRPKVQKRNDVFAAAARDAAGDWD